MADSLEQTDVSLDEQEIIFHERAVACDNLGYIGNGHECSYVICGSGCLGCEIYDPH